jgi:hypothetical protein
MTMNPRIFIIIIAGAIVAGSLAVTWSNVRATRSAESALIGLARTKDGVAQKIQNLQARLATIESERTAMKATSEAKPKTNTMPTGPAGKAPAMAARPNPLELIMQDPKLQNAFFASQRATLGTRYGPLFRQLGLAPGQIAKFEDIMIKREENNMDLMAAAQSQRLAPDSTALAALQKQSEDEVSTAAATLLSPADYSRWQEYERSVGVRGVVQNFAGAAVLEAMPLSAEQAEQLAQILADTSSRYGNGGKAEYNDVDWTTADRRLAGVLSEEQLKLFQQIEPLGGGPSRFGARLASAFGQAIQADHAKPAAPADKPPGG